MFLSHCNVISHKLHYFVIRNNIYSRNIITNATHCSNSSRSSNSSRNSILSKRQQQQQQQQRQHHVLLNKRYQQQNQRCNISSSSKSKSSNHHHNYNYNNNNNNNTMTNINIQKRYHNNMKDNFFQQLKYFSIIIPVLGLFSMVMEENTIINNYADQDCKEGNNKCKDKNKDKDKNKKDKSNIDDKFIGKIGEQQSRQDELHHQGFDMIQGDEKDNEYIRLARQNTARERKSHYKYVIIGAGTTASAAMESIINIEPHADILLISDELALPQVDVYHIRKIAQSLMSTWNEWRRHITSKLESEPDIYSSVPLTLLLKEEGLRLDIQKQTLTLSDGDVIGFDKCLIATAGKPRDLWAVNRKRLSYSLMNHINNCETLQDFEHLDQIAKESFDRNIAIIGGGFVGTEIALALAEERANRCGAKEDESEKEDCETNEALKVMQIYAEPAPLWKYIPMYLALHIKKKLNRAGIQQFSEQIVTDIRPEYTLNTKSKPIEYHHKQIQISSKGYEVENNKVETLKLATMGETKKDLLVNYAVLATTHVDPVVDIAETSGLEIDTLNGGIVVNSEFEAVSNVFAAGNVASYYDTSLGRRRVEMFDHCVNSGLLAGYNMAVQRNQATETFRRTYTHQPMFRSHLGAIDVLAIGLGEVDSRLKTVGIWVQNNQRKGEGCRYQRGVVYYLNAKNKIMGILLWNSPDLVERARHILRQQPRLSSEADLRRLITLGPDNWIFEIKEGPSTLCLIDDKIMQERKSMAHDERRIRG